MLKKISAQVKFKTIAWTKLEHLILKSLLKREKSVLFCGIIVAYNTLASLESEQFSLKFTGNLEPINFQRDWKICEQTSKPSNTSG